MAIFTSSRSPAASRPLAKVAAPHLSRAAKIRKADEILEKLTDARAVLPVAKIRSGGAAHLDAAICAVSEYLDAVKGGGK